MIEDVIEGVPDGIVSDSVFVMKMMIKINNVKLEGDCFEPPNTMNLIKKQT